jgi:hypothetical protein
MLGGILDAPDDQRVLRRVPGDPHHEQVAEALVEDDLGRDPRVGAPQDGGVRLLLLRHGDPPDALVDLVDPLSPYVALVAGHELLERRLRRRRPLVGLEVLPPAVRRGRSGARGAAAARGERCHRPGRRDGHTRSHESPSRQS